MAAPPCALPLPRGAAGTRGAIGSCPASASADEHDRGPHVAAVLCKRYDAAARVARVGRQPRHARLSATSGAASFALIPAVLDPPPEAAEKGRRPRNGGRFATLAQGEPARACTTGEMHSCQQGIGSKQSVCGVDSDAAKQWQHWLRRWVRQEFLEGTWNYGVAAMGRRGPS